jgi:hypothetical protein
MSERKSICTAVCRDIVAPRAARMADQCRDIGEPDPRGPKIGYGLGTPERSAAHSRGSVSMGSGGGRDDSRSWRSQINSVRYGRFGLRAPTIVLRSCARLCSRRCSGHYPINRSPAKGFRRRQSQGVT